MFSSKPKSQASAHTHTEREIYRHPHTHHIHITYRIWQYSVATNQLYCHLMTAWLAEGSVSTICQLSCFQPLLFDRNVYVIVVVDIIPIVITGVCFLSPLVFLYCCLSSSASVLYVCDFWPRLALALRSIDSIIFKK
jgi:hypothetical protein